MLKKLYFFLLIVLTLSIKVFSQNFEGKITDKNNEMLYGSTVFIKEANQGLACNEKGEFQVTLPTGKYTVEYRCLGYENLQEIIVLSANKKVTKHIVLQEKPIELAEVVISNKEDPAYEIMRKAIAKAPYYQQVIKEYEAESYIKGNMELTKVSKLIDKLSSDEGTKMSDYKGKLFLQESYNMIKFTAPDIYEQTVNAFSSSIPDNFEAEDVMTVTRASLYSPKYAGMISPLNPKAFTYYRFRYEGFTNDGGRAVNKIKIIPKLKDPDLMSGYLFIADDSWDIRNAEVTSSIFGIESSFIITYNEVADDIYLPTTYNNKAEGSILGVGGYFNYYASIKYNSITINDSIKNLAEKKSPKKKKKESLEIKRNDTYKIKTDSLATKRDSAFWTQIRNIPLNDREIVSYEIKDSVQHHLDSVRKKFHNSKFEITDLITGGQIGGDSTVIKFSYGGLIGALRDYNFVDGFGLGQKFDISSKFNNKRNRFAVSPEIYYTTARKSMIWAVNMYLDYAPMRLGNLQVSGGDTSADYNSLGANLFDNAYSSLLWARNDKMYYRKKYVSVKNNIDLANGLRLTTQLQTAKRDGDMQNNTTYSLFGSKRKIKENLYNPENFDLTSYDISLSYTPRYYYSIRNGKKYYRYSKHPSFRLSYSEGFSSWQKNNSKYRKAELTINQTVNTDLFSKFIYEVNGGSFIGSTRNVASPDFKHFNTSGDFYLITKTPYNTFLLLDPYEASTIDYWTQVHLNYYSKYILLKRLPFLQGKMFNEALHLKYLYSPNKKNYTEVGYSIDMMESLSLGAYCSFDKFKYEDFGVRFSFSMNLFN